MNQEEREIKLAMCERKAAQLAYIEAAREGNLIKVVDYIKEGVDMSCFSNGALLESCNNNHLSVVNYLLNEGIDVKHNAGLEVHIAQRNNNATLFEFLVRKDFPVKSLHPENDPNIDILSQDFSEYLNNDGKYLIEEGNYIQFAYLHNKPEIIDKCEKYMSGTIAEEILSCLEDPETENKIKKSLSVLR